MNRRTIQIASLLMLVSAVALALQASPFSVIRRATMESDIIVEGEILSVENVPGEENGRTAKLKVNQVVWGGPHGGCTLEISWPKNLPKASGDSELVARPSPYQLDEYIGKKALWFLVEDFNLRCHLYPVVLDEMPVEELRHLSMAVKDPDYVDPERPGFPKMRLVPELEADPRSPEKRAAMIEFLDTKYAIRTK